MQKLSNIRMALLAGLMMLVAAMTGQLHVVASAQAGAPAPLESATRAKSILDQIDRAKIDRIKDAGIRADMKSAYNALKAVADNTSRTSEKVLLARTHTIALKLKAKAEPPNTSSVTLNDCYATSDKCHEMGTPPEYCDLNFDGCVMLAWFSALFPPGAP